MNRRGVIQAVVAATVVPTTLIDSTGPELRYKATEHWAGTTLDRRFIEQVLGQPLSQASLEALCLVIADHHAKLGRPMRIHITPTMVYLRPEQTTVYYGSSSA